MTITVNRVYENGDLAAEPDNLDDTVSELKRSGRIACLHLTDPTLEELEDVGARFGLHSLAIEDAYGGHQRAKIERYGDTRFVVLKPARYDDPGERVLLSEIHAFVGENFFITVGRGEPGATTKQVGRVTDDSSLHADGPTGLLLGLIDHIVDGYAPVADGLENDLDEIEEALFASDESVAQRIYGLASQVTTLIRATRPVEQIIDDLTGLGRDDGMSLEVKRHFRGAKDNAIRVTDRLVQCRGQLENALTVNSTLVSERQNAEMERMTQVSLDQADAAKKISAWAGILYMPSMVGAIYGMNFRHMPELAWKYGYGAAWLLMIALSVVLYIYFKRKDWL